MDAGPAAVAVIAGLVALAAALAFAIRRVMRECERLRVEHERLRAVVDRVPSLVAYLDADGRYRVTNAQFQRLLNVDGAAAIGRTVPEVLGDAGWALIGPHLRAALAGEARRFERVREVDGREVHLQTDYLPDRAPDGRVRGVCALAVDVSELKKAQLAAQRDREQLVAITDNLPALVARIDLDERYTFANAQFASQIGLDPAAMIGRTVRELRPEFYDTVLGPHVQAALRGEARSFEGSRVLDGRTQHYRIDYIPDRGADGAVRGCFSLTIDLTATREAERASVRSEERLRRITDSLPVVISYLDAGQRLRFANRTLGEWFGVPVPALIGRTMAEIVGPALYAERRPYIERALAGERVEFEMEAEAGGVRRVTQTTIVPDIDEQGRVCGLYSLNTDVTPLKTVERRLQALARSDPLTGLPNRLHYDERLAEALARQQRSGNGLALMFLDIDRFKRVNDELGHAAGDAVLREFARRLRDVVRLTDLVARLAGDEFVVLLEGLHSDAEPQFVARKVLAQFQAPFDVDGRALEVTTSVGIAYHAAGAGTVAPSALLARADEALYRAKQAGRNTFRLA
ncbi:MAG: PAS domain-containing protein [Rubrivivax sp.]|nr:PAS domain-containing protein [Rubrivivax sp.]